MAKSLLLLVKLLNLPQPLRSVAVVLVQFILDDRELAVRLARKPDITVSPTEMLTAENDVCGLRFLLRVIRVQLGTLGVDLNLVAHLFECLHEVFLLA